MSIEQVQYYNKALEATKSNHPLLALLWRLVADASRNFFKQQHTNELLSTREPLLMHELTQLLQSMQEAHDALQKEPSFTRNQYEIFGIHASLTPDWIFKRGPFQSVAERYRHFLIHSQARTSHDLSQEIQKMTEAVTKYALLAPEVAFFVQEARGYFKKIHECSEHNSLLKRYRLLTTAYAALEVAVIYLHLEASHSWNNKILIHHWKEAALYGEHAFHFRIKAATATQQGDEMSAIECSLAAAAATQVCDAHARLLELFPRGDRCHITHGNHLLQAAEEAMEERKKSAAPDDKKRPFRAHAAFWSEHYYDCYINVLKNYSPHNPLSPDRWEKIALHAKQVATLWSRGARNEGRKSMWLPRTYYQKRALHEEKRHRTLLSHALEHVKKSYSRAL